jgi:type IV pilus assembly protein PilY1
MPAKMKSSRHAQAGPSRGERRSMRAGTFPAALLLAGALFVGTLPTAHAQMSISQMPALVPTPPPANIVFTIDDSGSMTYAYVPDSVANYQSSAAFASSAYNSFYYNPAVTYNIPPDVNGNPVPTAKSCGTVTCASTTFAAAYYDGFNPDLGTVNLGTSYVVTLTMAYSNNPPSVRISNAAATTGGVAGAAFYNTFNPNSTYSIPNPAGGQPINVTCVSQLVPGQPPPPDSPCFTTVTVGAGEQQNFANWFSFYRTRHLTLISAAATAMQDAGLANTRVAWQGLNTCSDNFQAGTSSTGGCQGWRGDTFIDKISYFTGSHKSDFYNWLFELPAGSYTPTRVAWWRAGNFFSRTDLGSNGPYGKDPNDPPSNPAATTNNELMCAYNFNVTLTDGLWNQGSEGGDTTFCGLNGNATACGHADSTATTFPDNTIYTPSTGAQSTTIYGDGTNGGSSGLPLNNTVQSGKKQVQVESGGLSDIAFYYWATNLRPDLTGFSVPAYFTPISSTNPLPDTTNPLTGQSDSTWPYWNSVNDPATWPHLVNFTVGVGLTSFLQLPGLNWSGDAHLGSAYTNLLGAASNCPQGSTMGLSAPQVGELYPETPTCVWPQVDASGSGNGYTGGLAGAGNVYDLWHAAIASRGNAFSSESAQDVVGAMKSIFARIEGQARGNSGASGSSPSLSASATTDLFVASYDGSDWHGTVTAYSIDPTSGNVNATADWQTSASSIAPFASRAVYSAGATLPASGSGTPSNPGITFDLNSLTTNNMLVAADGWTTSPSPVLNYLLGDSSNEQRNGGTYRNRPVTVLGDIVDSYPVYSWQEDFGYANLPQVTGSNIYAGFVANKSSRMPMVYVGGNDGMLHGFNATSGSGNGGGTEIFAYVPHTVVNNMPALDNPSYLHHFYVDGPSFVGDAYYGNSWHSVLIGTTGAGGPGVFALDVTNPSSFNGSKSSAQNVIWDLDGNASIDVNLGATIGQPIIALLNDGNWAAIFGNGYSSSYPQTDINGNLLAGARGCAVLYVVYIPSGQIRTIDTSNNVSTTSACPTLNGLGSVTLLDLDQNGTTDYVYAGDLQGNLWKFDLTNTDPTKWGVAKWSNSNTASVANVPLFTAINSANVRQPIVAAPNLGPTVGNVNGYFVYFDTGHIFATGDASDTTTQSMYAIQDQGRAITATSRSTLVQQVVISTADGNEDIQTPYPTVNLYSVDGWYIDLPNAGERSLSTPLLINGMLLFTTVIPQANPCSGDCKGFVYAVNAFDGNGGTGFLTDGTTAVDALADTVGCVKSITVISGNNGTLNWYLSGNGTNFGSGASATANTGTSGGPGNNGQTFIPPSGPNSNSIQHGKGLASAPGRVSWHEHIINQ